MLCVSHAMMLVKTPVISQLSMRVRQNYQSLYFLVIKSCAQEATLCSLELPHPDPHPLMTGLVTLAQKPESVTKPCRRDAESRKEQRMN